jgi:hypothetical protein
MTRTDILDALAAIMRHVGRRGTATRIIRDEDGREISRTVHRTSGPSSVIVRQIIEPPLQEHE